MDTSRLTTAAENSGALSSALGQRAEEVRTMASVPAAIWFGPDEAAAAGLVANQVPPLFDAADAFRRGKATLEDLVTAIAAAKEHLKGAHTAVEGRGILIDPQTGMVTTPVVDNPEVAAENDRLAEVARNIITEALKMASDADTTAVDLLAGVANTQVNFDGTGGQTPLARAVELFNTKAEDATGDVASQLAKILADNKNNPDFARQFMEQIGAEGLIDNTAKFSQIGADLNQEDTAATQPYKELQTQLGETLAAASQDGGLSQQWVQELMDKGAAPLEGEYPDRDGYGYQALAPLLEHGEYDKSLLTPVAEHMTRLDQYVSENGLTPDFDNPYVIGQQDPTPSASNPMNSVMTALDNSPEAASDFFDGHNTEQGFSYENAVGKPLDPTESNVEYMLDRAAGSHGLPMDVDRVGNALEAAATGVSSDTPAEAPRPERTAEMAGVAEELVSHFGGPDANQIEPGGKLDGMADNMTDVAAQYMPDIHNSLLQPGGSDVALDPKGVDADFDAVESQRMLHALGQHQESVDTLMGANDATRAMMVEQGYQTHGTDEGWLQKSLEPGSSVGQILADSAGDDIEQGFADSDASHKNRVEWVASGAYVAAGMIPNPLVNGVAFQAVSQFKDEFYIDTGSQGTYQADKVEYDLRAADTAATYATVEAVLNEGGLTPEEEAFRKYAYDEIPDAEARARDNLPREW